MAMIDYGCIAKVNDNAHVYGNAQVYDKAHVYDNARVYDNAKIYCNATVREKYYELQAGKSALRRFRRLRKRKNRPNKWDRNRPNKFCAKWEHNGNKYEIVFGYGIPWSKKEYLSMKKDNVFDKYYNYTKDEIKKVEEMYNR